MNMQFISFWGDVGHFIKDFLDVIDDLVGYLGRFVGFNGGLDHINLKVGLDEDKKDIEKDKAPGWDDVGGLFEAKRKLREIIDNSVKYSFLFKDNPKMLNSGILLYGPPGWGK